MSPLGPLNRSGRLYRNTPTTGAGGAVVDSLTALRDLPITVVEQTSASELAGQRDAEATEGNFITRWFDDLSVGMVLVFEGKSYRITKRVELGRRAGWRIYGKEVA